VFFKFYFLKCTRVSVLPCLGMQLFTAQSPTSNSTYVGLFTGLLKAENIHSIFMSCFGSCSFSAVFFFGIVTSSTPFLYLADAFSDSKSWVGKSMVL